MTDTAQHMMCLGREIKNRKREIGSQMVHCKVYNIGIDGRMHVHPT